MPSTSLSATFWLTDLSVSLADSTADFWWRAVVVKAARVRVDVVVVVARRRVTAAVLDVSADIVSVVLVYDGLLLWSVFRFEGMESGDWIFSGVDCNVLEEDFAWTLGCRY
jgi:hypothetical protein